jgi:UDPglucose 6-dehydrogenase
MLAARISLMNEIATLCEATDSDVEDVRRGVGLDERLGSAFLFPGVGYGGSCFPKDVKALIQMAEQNGLEARILRAVDDVNNRQKQWLFDKAARFVGADLGGVRLAVWGLSFKPRTDDMREAPAVPIIEGLLDRGAKVQAYDPEATTVARGIFGSKIKYAPHAYEALTGADALLIVTEWNEFREPDFARMKKEMKEPLILDGRNLYAPAQVRGLGFAYHSIGRP